MSTTADQLGRILLGTGAWMVILIGCLLARYERRLLPRRRETRLVVGRSWAISLAVGAISLLLFYGLGGLANAHLEGGRVIGLVTGFVVLSSPLPVGWLCLYAVQPLVQHRRIIVDDDGIRLCWLWGLVERKRCRWAEPHRFEIFSKTVRISHKNGGHREVPHELYRIQTATDDLWILVQAPAHPVPAPRAPATPVLLPWIRMHNMRGRFYDDPRIVNLRRGLAPVASDPRHDPRVYGAGAYGPGAHGPGANGHGANGHAASPAPIPAGGHDRPGPAPW